jgi:DUF2407 C-terminal domain
MNSLSDDENDADCHRRHAVTDPLLVRPRECSVDDSDDDNDVEEDDDDDDDDDDDLDTVSDDDKDNDDFDKEEQEMMDATTENNKPILLRIKCSHYKDVTIRVRPSDSIARVKEKVLFRLQRENAESSSSSSTTSNTKFQDAYVRLIAKGRLLAPDATKMREFIMHATTNININNNNNNTRLVLRNDDVLHAVLAPRQAPGQAPGPQAVLQQPHFHNNNNSGGGGGGGAAATTALRGAGIDASGLVVPSQPGEFDDEENDDSTVEEEETEEEVQDVDLERGGQASSSSPMSSPSSSNTTNRRATTTTSSSSSSSSSSSRRRGFDRLRNAGLRRSEVSAVRAYFSRHVDRFVRQHADFATAIANSIPDTEPDALLRRRHLQEEAWMLAQGPLSEFRINLSTVNVFNELQQSSSNNPFINAGINNMAAAAAAASGSAGLGGIAGPPSTLQARQNAAALQQFRQRSAATASTSSEALWRAGGISAQVGTDKDFLWGFLLGFFVGFFMLVWVWMPTVPHKQKLGILTGISFQLALGMLKQGNNSSGAGGEDYNADYDLYNLDEQSSHHLRGGGGRHDVILVGD